MLFILLCAASGAVASDVVQVRPSIDLRDPRLAVPCRWEAWRANQVVRSSSASLELSPGTWRLVAYCTDPRGIEVPIPGPMLRAARGRPLAPRVVAKAAPVRVEAGVNGERALARVALRLDDVAEPIARFSAHETVWVGRGPWTFSVGLSPPDRPARQVDLPAPRWRTGRKTTVMAIDLSDGWVSVVGRLNRKPAPVIVHARGAEGEEGPAFGTGRRIALPPGQHRLRVTLADASDFAAQALTVHVKPGQHQRLTADFEGGWLDIDLTRSQRRLAADVQLARVGAGKPFNYVRNPGRALLRPGRYRLWVDGPAAGPLERVDFPEVTVRARRTTRLRRDLSLANLQVVLTNVAPDAPKVRVRYAGGGEAVSETESLRYRLWPGRYEVEVDVGAPAPLMDGPFTVGWGDSVRRTIDIPLNLDGLPKGDDPLY